ncbi:MAG: PqqD family protein [Ignavibacteriales bacterium]|nr:PqqD family protein [Ignavibacteriales bacterium]
MTDYKYLYPVQSCESEVNNELITLLHKKKKPTFIEKTFFKKYINKIYKIDLDEIGSFVWQQINGKNSIGDIINATENKFGEKVKPTEERVTLFIKQLHKNKFIQLFQRK